MSCHLSRLNYELFTNCVTPIQCHARACTSSWQLVTPWKQVFEHFKIFATTWPASPRIPTHCHEFFPHWHAKLRKPCVVPVCQCEACLRVCLSAPAVTHWDRVCAGGRQATATLVVGGGKVRGWNAADDVRPLTINDKRSRHEMSPPLTVQSPNSTAKQPADNGF